MVWRPKGPGVLHSIGSHAVPLLADVDPSAICKKLSHDMHFTEEAAGTYLWSSYGAKHSTTTSLWVLVSATQLTDLEYIMMLGKLDYRDDNDLTSADPRGPQRREPGPRLTAAWR